jgi:hypothetical protein
MASRAAGKRAAVLDRDGSRREFSTGGSARNERLIKVVGRNTVK